MTTSGPWRWAERRWGSPRRTRARTIPTWPSALNLLALLHQAQGRYARRRSCRYSRRCCARDR
ncbi:MAG: hypothetical protein M0C28_42040 [Candidatus Moduliflexus flocculans]|nr:hypothetical protein [Candidatus Moduliflexus flocculans]